MTSDRLAAAVRAGGVLAPDHGGMCLDGVLPAAAEVLGLDPGPDDLPGRGAAARFGLAGAPRVCVVLVDGMGLDLVTDRKAHAPFLRARLADARALTSSVPSTTATSMGLLGTGRAAGRTGLAGYTVRNPKTGDLANLVSWDGATEPRRWQREPSLLAGMAGRTEVTSVGPGKFAGSGLTAAALHGARYVAAESLDDRVDATLRALRRPGLAHLYWGDVDKAGHQYGWRSPQWAEALAETDRGLGRLARSLPPDTLLLVTADHGIVDIDRAHFVDVAHEPVLAAGVDLVAGEPRACHLYTGEPAEVAARWRDRLGSLALVVERAEIEAAGWFGPVADHVRPVLGDVVVLALGRAAFADSRTQTPHSLTLVGMHGSVTPGEMLVPLFVERT